MNTGIYRKAILSTAPQSYCGAVELLESTTSRDKHSSIRNFGLLSTQCRGKNVLRMSAKYVVTA